MTKIIKFLIYFLVFALPLAPKIPSSVGNIYLATILVTIILCLWITKKLKNKLRFINTNISKILFFFICILLSFTAINLEYLLSRPDNFLRIIQFILYASLYFVVLDIFNKESEIKQLVRFFFSAVFIEVSIAIIHYFHPLFIINKFYTFGSEHWKIQMVGTFSGEHVSFASYIMFSLIMLLCFLLFQNKWRISILGLVFLLFYCFLFSFSRTAYIAFCAGIVAIFIIDKKPIINKIRKEIILILVLAGMFFIITEFTDIIPIIERAETIRTFAQGKYTAGRIDVWSTIISNTMNNPFHIFIGFGIWKYRVIDNFFIKMFVETGIIGTAIFLYLIYSIFRECFKARRKVSPKDSFFYPLIIGCLTVSFTHLIIFNFAADQMIIHRVMGNFWIFLGLLSVYNIKIAKRKYV